MRSLARLLTAAIVLVAACSAPDSPEPRTIVRARETSVRTMAVVGPVEDTVMGTLSPVAHFISAALRERRARMAIREALLNEPRGSNGLDLSRCGSNTALAALMAAGEHAGAGAARAICKGLAAKKGITLWMNPGWLRTWDGARMPLVAALDNPAAPLPKIFKGYADKDRVVFLPADGSLNAPILVVLGEARSPEAHHGVRSANAHSFTVR